MSIRQIMTKRLGSDRVIEKVIGVIVFFIALGAITGAAFFYIEGKSTVKWPSVEGMVIKSDTRIQKEPGKSSTPTTIADVWYAYSVDGVQYQNDTISHAQYGSSSATHAVREAHKYPEGSRLVVYYNPENPNDSILEHKMPWIFIGLFAGLGILCFFIAIGMYSGGFGSNPYASSKGRAKPTSFYNRRKLPKTTGRRMVILFIIISVLVTGMFFFFTFNNKIIVPEKSQTAGSSASEINRLQMVSTYSSTDTLSSCNEWLKQIVAESQKVYLKDEIHTLYVTAILCVDEEEMKTDSQSHQTWPTIASHLATYDKEHFNPEADLLILDGIRTYKDFELKLRQMEKECVEFLRQNNIFFIKAVQFQHLHIYSEN
jgi:hypothetical protein